jgi:Ca2+-binding RTX toxin-like protein
LDVTLGVLSSENGGSPAILGNMTPDYLMVHEPSVFNVNGGNGNDRIIGTGWGDQLDGGGGRDRMEGRGGNDIYYIDNALDVVAEVAGEGFDTVSASVSYTLQAGVSVESLVASDPTDPVNLTGNSYNQTIEGSDTANTLKGMAGNDSLFGYLGGDVLLGGLGRDQMSGHGGADRFDFNSVKESVVGTNRDVVRDFTRSQGDKIDLLTIDADTDGTAGNQAFKWIGSKAFSGVDGQLRFAGGILSSDTNGDKKADFQIQIIGTLTAADVIL